MYVNAGVVCGADTYVKIVFNSQEEREPFKMVQVVPAFSSSLYKFHHIGGSAKTCYIMYSHLCYHVEVNTTGVSSIYKLIVILSKHGHSILRMNQNKDFSLAVWDKRFCVI